MKRNHLFTITIITSVFIANIYAQPGSLDNTFSTDGKLITPVGTGQSFAKAIFVQPDSKIVVAGYASNGSTNEFALVRYTSTGALDNSFNTTGQVLTGFAHTGGSMCTSIAIQADHKIVAAGYSGFADEIELARYHEDGSLDSLFGLNGKVITAIGTQVYCNAIAIQPDGRIIAGGRIYSSSTGNRFLAVRYETNGTLDTTFSGDGIATTQIHNNGIANAMAIQPNDGKIILAGNTFNAATLLWELALVRYHVDGTPDTSFGNNSIVITPVGNLNTPVSSDNFIKSIALQPDGKIVVAGSAGTGAPDNKFILARYLPNGTLDNSFGNNGVLFSQVGTINDEATSVIVEQDKIFVGGDSKVGSTTYTFVIACYNSDGSFDNTFGGTGIVTTPVGSNDGINAMALQPDRKIVAAGIAFENSVFNFGVARYISGLPVGINPPGYIEYAASLYPNPSDKQAILEYTLKETQYVTISLMDDQGKVIQTILNNARQEAGLYQQNLFFQGIPAGSYFIQISTPKGHSTIRMIKV